MNDLVIRPAEAADAAPVIEIHSRSVQELCSGDYTARQIEVWAGKRTPEDMASRIAMHPYFVAEFNGKLLGYAAYSLNSNELLSIFVDPDYTRQGVASALMNELLADARSSGLTTLWLDSSLTAVPFYEKAGFTTSVETIHIFDGVLLECLRMELSLKG